jgi:hypothetical protein
MIVAGLLGPLFLSPEEILSDTTIDKIQRAGRIVLADPARAELREIVRDYLFKRRWVPPTQKKAQQSERDQKRYSSLRSCDRRS